MKIKCLLAASLLWAALLGPVNAQEFELTGLEFAGKDVVWLECDIPQAAYIAVGDEVVALVARTRSGRFEVLLGSLQEAPDGSKQFVVSEPLAWIDDPLEAPQRVLEWLEKNRRLGSGLPE